MRSDRNADVRLAVNVTQEIDQGGVGLLPDLLVRVGDHVEEAVEELREELDELNIGDAVQHDDPSDEELSDERVDLFNAAACQFHIKWPLFSAQIPPNALLWVKT